MDRKSILILLVSVSLLLAWYPMVNKLFPPKEKPAGERVAQPTNALAQPVTPVAETLPEPPPELVRASTPGLSPTPTEEEQTLTLETASVRYHFSSYGGGIKYLELKNQRRVVGRQAKNLNPADNLATLNSGAPAPVFTLLGDAALQGDDLYTLDRRGNIVTAEKLLPNGLRVVKEFEATTNYLVSVRVRIENRTNQVVSVPAHEYVVGTATPIDDFDKAMFMGFVWYDGNKAHRVTDSFFANRTLGCFPGTPRHLYQAGNSNVVWNAVHNQFFTMAAIPDPTTPAPQLVARKVNLPPPPADELAQHRKMIAKPFGLQTAFLYPGQALAVGQTLERNYTFYAGPKEYRNLDRLGIYLNNRLDLIMGFTGFFGFFAKALLLSMNGIHALGLSYGLSIVVITIIIKLFFWPLTQISTRSMKRMQTLQPQMKAIQKKYKDEPQKMNRKTMEFMKENKVNPAAGCLPILIQLPIFIGFYRMIQSAIELRGASFLWASDLSQPDTIFVIPGIDFPINPLPLIMGATQLWQTRLTPPAPGADPVQQKMMQFMPLMFLFILYNFSSGLTLYWTVQNLLQIVQMKLTKSVGTTPATAATVPAKPVGPQPGKQKRNKR